MDTVGLLVPQAVHLSLNISRVYDHLDQGMEMCVCVCVCMCVYVCVYVTSSTAALVSWAVIVHQVVHVSHSVPAEEVCQGLNSALRHALMCSILLANTHAYKYSWQLKRFSRDFAEGSEGLCRLKGLLFEDKYRGAEDQSE